MTHFTRLGTQVLLLISTALTPALAQTQTTKLTPPTEKPTPADKNSTQQLPFADARNMAVAVIYAPGGVFAPQNTGSGVWVGQHGYIVTCWHVVKDHPTGWRIHVPEPGFVGEDVLLLSATTIGAELVAYDKDTDIAILKTNTTPAEFQPTVGIAENSPRPLVPFRPISPKGATLETEFPKAGDTMLLAGFPFGQFAVILQTGTATGFCTYLANPTPETRVSRGLRIGLSLISNAGQSGGPVLDTGGKLVGLLEGNMQVPVRDAQGRNVHVQVVKWDDAHDQPMRDANGQVQFDVITLTENSGTSFAVPAKFIQELADSKNIKLD